MSLMRLPWSRTGRVITFATLLAFGLTVTGCIDPVADSSGDGYGVIVNTDITKSTLGGVRLKTGESAYLYGAFNDDGTVGEVNSTLFQDANGQQLKLFFESGRPVLAVGADGSRLEVAYTEVTATRLAGQAVFTPADGSAPAAFPFDVDLQQTAADLAATVQQLTGLQISSDPPPDGSAGPTSKPAVREHSVKVVVVPVFISITGFLVVQVVAGIMSSVARTATAVGQAVTLAVLTPLIVMGNIMRSATGQPLITVDLSGPTPNINIPPPPSRS